MQLLHGRRAVTVQHCDLAASPWTGCSARVKGQLFTRERKDMVSGTCERMLIIDASMLDENLTFFQHHSSYHLGPERKDRFFGQAS